MGGGGGGGHIHIFVFTDHKAVFHSIISPPPAKNFDIEIIFLRSCVAENTCSAGPVVENFFADGTKELTK